MSTSYAQLCASALSVCLLASVASAAEPGTGVLSPADHAPAGVMADHTHEAGEFMVGYRYMFDYSGEIMLDGDRKAGDPELAHAGFSATGERMTMHMHMLDIMYAPADWVTLMVMPQYMTMNMRMREVEGGTGHGGHGGHGGHSGAHEHGVSGFGDTAVAVLFRLLHANGQHIHATVGFSMPTGSVSERGNDGRYTHYMMQLGSGTWDFLPGLTYSGHSGAWGWGAQLAATIKLDEENDSGFRFGDRYQATVWGSRTLADWLSASLRLAYAAQGNIFFRPL